MLLQAFCIISKQSANSNWSYSPETPNLGQTRLFFPCDLETWTPLLFQALCIISKQSVNSNLSYSPKTPDLGQTWLFFPCDLEIWRMTLRNIRATLVCYCKIFASFQNNRRIQTGVTVRKRPFGSKSAIFCPVWPWNLTDDLEKQ